MTTVSNLGERRRPTFDLRHRLVLAREVADLDQTAIGEALGISRQTVSNYERGATMPRRAMIAAWALATGVDVDWLATGAEESPLPGGPDGGLTEPLVGIEPTTYSLEAARSRRRAHIERRAA